ncbi:uncharacterized protein LOC117760043 isoform X1 [Hippoglossus hippoglossus]|uniref:uncharacterized protein LOC117760043 isoform X1 n=1 Tax=Hippoglossus hippoglossus TaxID=8267 RepID=UPI00148B51F6|nr:uncharacterized protein LOC117760043 isoform X1 [Hippoglossus hippoglossus]
MDFKTVVTISALLLITAGNFSKGVNLSSAVPATDAAPTSNPSISSPVRSFLTVKWTGNCEGQLILHHNSTPSHVCHDSNKTIQSLLTNVCENKKGCKDPLDWKKGKDMPSGYHIIEDRAEQRISCVALKVKCKAEPVEVKPDVQEQLHVYKTVTALLGCVLVVLFLIRFCRPTVKALQKRLSDRSQTRWVGPTQSHSVSHHRGNTCNNDGEKRLSYPALERLTVSDSREPSSNRSSGYNF